MTAAIDRLAISVNDPNIHGGNPVLAISFNPAECGAALAHATDEEQAALVNAFFNELAHITPSHYRAQMQIAYVTGKLGKVAKDILEVQEQGV